MAWDHEELSLLHPLIARRRSGRLFDPAMTVTRAQVTNFLHAARWAPTWGKRQPVRFVVGLRGDEGKDETFTVLHGALTRGNKSWAGGASALVLVAAVVTEDERAAEYEPVDVGLAVGQLLLQAVADGLIAHPMAGFDKEQVRSALDMPTDSAPYVVVAVGHDGSALAGQDPDLVEKEKKTRERLPLHDVAYTRKWGEAF